MVGIATIGLMLVAPAAPVPGQVPDKVPKSDRWKAEEFARIVYQTADQVAAKYAKPVEMKDLIAAAVRGMYEECGLTVPDRVTQAIRDANGGVELVSTLADVRQLLAGQTALRGPRALYAAINGFQHATEPLCQLASPRANTFATVDMDFGIGIELEGVRGKAWNIYQIDYGAANGRYPTSGWLEDIPRENNVAAPCGIPWRLQTVIPDSPAAKAGLRPGDVITHFSGAKIDADNANKLFAQFAFTPPQVFDPQAGVAKATDYTLTLRRGTEKPFSTTIKRESYTPMSAFGVIRTGEEKWECMLDRTYKIGYVRLGTVGMDLDVKLNEMLADLDRRGCRGLILDLRWCPGGYVNPAVRVAGLFLPNEALISQMKYRNTNNAENEQQVRNNFGIGNYTRYPLVVLIGPETIGGGELIAAGLRDNDRCVLMGQRTAGRASIQNIVETGFGGLQFKVTTGESFRPNGKPRKRNPDSGPHDDWGLKPEEGLEVPLTLDKSKELRRWADLHSLRPFDSNEALDFDDPDKDPYRVKALDYLRKKIGKPKEK